MDIYKPTEDDLRPLLEQATAKQSVDKWMEKFLAGTKRILLANPLRYRGYGPYWWPLKKLYLDRDDHSFGEFVDQQWLATMAYAKPEFTLLAAFAYEEMRTTKNFIDDPYHVLDNPDGSDSVEYASNDPEMEMMAIAAGL